MLVRGMVQHELGDDPQPALLGLAHERFEIRQRAVNRVDGIIIRDVIPVILERRRIKREQPQRGDAEVLNVIKLLRQPAKISDAVRVAVEKRADGDFINNCAFVPERIQFLRCAHLRFGHVIQKGLTAYWQIVSGADAPRSLPIKHRHRVQVVPFSIPANAGSGATGVLQHAMYALLLNDEMQRLDQSRDDNTGGLHGDHHHGLAAPGAIGLFKKLEPHRLRARDGNQPAFHHHAFRQGVPMTCDIWPHHVAGEDFAQEFFTAGLLCGSGSVFEIHLRVTAV